MGLSISSRCMQSYPCQHVVRIKGKKKVMLGNEIYSYCIDKHLRVPKHFKQYEKYVQEQDIIDAIRSGILNYTEDVINKNIKYVTNLYETRYQSCTFTIEAAKKDSLEILKLLHEKYAIPINNRCLIEATRVGNSEMVVYLLKQSKSKRVQGKINPMIPENGGVKYTKYCETAYSVAATTYNYPLMVYFETKVDLTYAAVLHALSKIEYIKDVSVTSIKNHLLDKKYEFDEIEKKQRISNLQNLIENEELTEKLCYKMLSDMNKESVEEYNIIWKQLNLLKPLSTHVSH
jgi:hypothetical protein